jgi:hypothetical protein
MIPLRIAEPEGASHRTQLSRALWNTAGLDGSPCERLHTGQAGCLLDGFLLATTPDGSAEDPAPELAVGLVKVILATNSNTHMHITLDERAPSSESRVALI